MMQWRPASVKGASVLPTTEWLVATLIPRQVRLTAGHGLDFAPDSRLTRGFQREPEAAPAQRWALEGCS